MHSANNLILLLYTILFNELKNWIAAVSKSKLKRPHVLPEQWEKRSFYSLSINKNSQIKPKKKLEWELCLTQSSIKKSISWWIQAFELKILHSVTRILLSLQSSVPELWISSIFPERSCLHLILLLKCKLKNVFLNVYYCNGSDMISHINNFYIYFLIETLNWAETTWHYFTSDLFNCQSRQIFILQDSSQSLKGAVPEH